MQHFIATILLLLATVIPAHCQELYIKTFGAPTSTPLIFLHGGPGYNSAAFEATTPQRLAASGFYVIVYDRRGEGRSKDTAARFTFTETTADLLRIYERYNLKTAALLGHSFGGIVGAKFAEAHPERVRALVLVAAPIDLQESFRNILARCRAIYESANDSVKLTALAAVSKLDTASLMYSTYCFGHAMQNGFYTPKSRSAEARAVYDTFQADAVLFRQASQMDFRAPRGFWENERYTTTDLRPGLKALLASRIPVYGLYGTEDGLYAPEQISELKRMAGERNVRYLENCSHNVFIDQQAAFITALRQWLQ